MMASPLPGAWTLLDPVLLEGRQRRECREERTVCLVLVVIPNGGGQNSVLCQTTPPTIRELGTDLVAHPFKKRRNKH